MPESPIKKSAQPAKSVAPAPQAGPGRFDFLKADYEVFITTLLRRLPWIVLAGLLGLGAASFAAKKLVKNNWKSSCVLYRQPQNSEMKKEMPQFYEPLEMSTVVESIRTRKNILRVIQELGLDMPPSAFFGKTEIVKLKNSNIITIVAQDLDPEMAAKIANKLAEIFLEEYREMANGSAVKVAERYQDSIVNLKKSIAEQEAKSRDFMERNKITSLDAESGLRFQQLKDIELKLLESRTSAESAKVRVDSLSKAIAVMDPEVKLSYVVSPPGAGKLEELQKQLDALTQKFTDDNPKVQRIRAELDTLRQKIAEGEKPAPGQITYGGNQERSVLMIERMKAEAELQGAELNVTRFEKEIISLRSQLDVLSRLEGDYKDMRRKVDGNRKMLAKLENMLSVNELAIKSSSADIKILEPAVPASAPESGKRKLIAIGGGLGAFAIAFVLALLLEYLDFSVKSKFDLDSVLGIKALGCLPDQDGVNMAVFHPSFQVVFDNLRGELRDARRPVVAVGSVRGEVGKSFLIAEFSELLLADDVRILHIDSVEEPDEDIKPHVINEFLYGVKSPAVFAALPSPTKINKAYFVLDEHSYRFPLDDARLKAFLDGLDGYDYIFWELFDFKKNPRLFAAVCRQSDLAVLVGRFRRTGKPQLLSCVSFLRSQKCPALAGILNYVDRRYFKTEFV